MLNRVYVYSNHVVDCRLFDGTRKKNFNPLSISNLDLKYTKGDISKSASLKVKKIAECYLTAITIKNIVAHRNATPKIRLPVFITLTYPSVQIHDDNYLKRNHLTPFLRWLVQTKKCAAYLWRGETQQNGNLHFHIFTDKFISWSDVRAVWNSIVDKDNYVQAFFAVHNHTNPNSTDIKAVNDPLKAAKYLTKYITKGGKDARKQQGRVWGMSDNLRGLKVYHDDGFEREIFLDGIKGQIEVREQLNDFVSIYKYKDSMYKVLHKANNNMLADYENYYINCCKSVGL